MAEQTVDLLLEPHDRTLMIRLVTEHDRLRAAVSIPVGDGEEEVGPGEVDLGIAHSGTELEALEPGELRQVRTHLRGATAHFLREFALPLGVQVGQGKEAFLCTLSFRNNRRSVEVVL